MADMQAMFPVMLPKRSTEDSTLEDYNTQVAQNENMLNQNFNILYEQTMALTDEISALRKYIESLRGE